MFKDGEKPAEETLNRIDIWGSCVSRDTLGFMPEFQVGTYVARQSAIVGLAPATDVPTPLHALESEFQRRMLSGDMAADAGERLEAGNAVCVLIDLVDERRGVWCFPDGTYLTNSIEAFRVGINEWGPEMGARLIEFGTDEHFQLWRQGFTLLARRLMRIGKPIILLDIAWAGVFEGQTQPLGPSSKLGSAVRRGKHTVLHLLRTVERGRPILTAVSELMAAPSTVGDIHIKRARQANQQFRRYADEAHKLASATIRRPDCAVRMSRSHRWGIAPYHYSDRDYERICAELCAVLSR